MTDWDDSWGPYKSRYCHECREDSERMKVAMESDGKAQVTVMELVCRGCGLRLAWWWFSKLPLTPDEIEAVKKRGGKAW